MEVDDRTKMIGFPQTYHYPHIVVDLVNGYQAFMVDCTSTVSLTSGLLKVSPDISRTAFIDAAATLVGPSAFDAGGGPSFDGLKIQITGSDRMIAPHPIASVAFPSRREPDLSSEWSVTESLPRESRDSDGQAVVCGYWDCSFSPPNGFGYRVAFSPVMSVELSEPITLERMISDWIEPLHQIVGLSTGRDEAITYAALRSAGGERYSQVFGSNITQTPFASDHNAVRRTKHAFTCFQDDDASLLRLCRGWQRARDELHPLIESLAAFMYVPRQHPRPRFLLLCQALEGLYGFDNRVRVARRRDSDRLLFFGGTALNRTHLIHGRLSEDIDLIAIHDRRSIVADLTEFLPRAAPRDFGLMVWDPPLDFRSDTNPGTLRTSDGIAVRVQLLNSTGYPAWPTERRILHERYRDVGLAELIVPTRPAFAAWKTMAWNDRHASRDLWHLNALAQEGAINEFAVQMFVDHGPTGRPQSSWMFTSSPSPEQWQSQLAGQTRLRVGPAEAFDRVRTSWESATSRWRDGRG